MESEIIALKSKPELVKMVYDLLDKNRELKEKKPIVKEYEKPVVRYEKVKSVEVIRYIENKPIQKGIKDIISAVCLFFSMTEEEFLSDARLNKFVTARQVFVFIARKVGYTFVQIGAAMKRDHSTAIHHQYNFYKKVRKGIISEAALTFIERYEK